MERREFVIAGAASISSLLLRQSPASASTSARPRRKNVLFITVDDMNWSMFGFLKGMPKSLTPHLDALSARSFCLRNNRTTAPICQPSREAMMTGLLPHHSGALGFNPVRPGVPTLVTILRDHGYLTCGIHKTEHMQPPAAFPWDIAVKGSGRNPQEYVDAVSAAISRAEQEHRPFFINCNLNDPHRPFYGSAGAAAPDHNETGPYHVPHELKPGDIPVPGFLEDLEPVRLEMAQYGNNVQRLDLIVGKLLDVLAHSHAADDTIVVFTPDHGMPFPFAKGTVYDNGTRTPVILHVPGMEQPAMLDDLTMNIDILPTLLEMLEIAAPSKVDGLSWVPLLHGDHRGSRKYQITHVNTMFGARSQPMRALQDDRYSFVFSAWSDGRFEWTGDALHGESFPAMAAAAKTDARIAQRVRQCVIGTPLALYDFKEDPGQRINLMQKPEQKARAVEMARVLLTAMEATDDPQSANLKSVLAGGKSVVPQDEQRAWQAAHRDAKEE